MRINEMIPKGKSYHLQSNRPFALVGHVINFRSTREQFTFEKFCQHELKDNIIRQPVNFQPYISKVGIVTATENQMDLYENNNSCHPVMLEWFSMEILVNFESFKLSSNLSLMPLRVQSACYELNQQKVMTFFQK